MSKIISKGYRKQQTLFKNWRVSKTAPCPICGRFYITAVRTGKSIIYVHTNGLTCESRHE